MNSETSGNSTWNPEAARTGLAVVLGVMLGLWIAVSLRRKSGRPAGSAPDAEEPAAQSNEPYDFAEARSAVLARRSAIYQEGLKASEDAGKVWTLGRKLAGN